MFADWPFVQLLSGGGTDHMSLRALQRRVAKIEKGRKPRPSPFVILCGSFDAFADATYAEVEAGKLDSQFLHVLDIICSCEEGGMWMLAYARTEPTYLA